MIKLWIYLCCLSIAILDVLTARTSTTPKPTAPSNILDKFHQSDYKLQFEWTERVRNDERLARFEIHTFKYNRTTTAANASFVPSVDMGNDIEAIVQIYKFASNEYRLFPLRMQFNFCEAISKKTMGFDRMTECGNFSCPILKGRRYHYCNWSPDESRFPPFIPSGKYMMEMVLMHRSNEVLVTRSYGTILRPLD